MDDILAHIMCFSDLHTREVMSRVCKTFRDIHRLAPLRADFDTVPDHVASRSTWATVTPANFSRFAFTNFIYLHSVRFVDLCSSQVYFAVGLLPASCKEVYLTQCGSVCEPLQLEHLALECFGTIDSNVAALPNCSTLQIDATSVGTLQWGVPNRLRHLVLLEDKSAWQTGASSREAQLFQWLARTAPQLESLTMHCLLTDALLASLGETVFPKVETLVLTGNTRYLWDTAHVFRRMFPRLKSLTIDDCNVVGWEIDRLHLPKWALTALCITGNDTLTWVGPLPQSLESVNLCGNGLSSVACIQACRQLCNLKTAVLPRACGVEQRDLLNHVHSVWWQSVRPARETLVFKN